jgi:hypothetical protein
MSLSDRDLSQIADDIVSLGGELRRLAAVAAVDASGPEGEPARPEAGVQGDVIVRAWKEAGVKARCKFIQVALDASHPWQAALGEASGLLDLAGEPERLSDWIERYPTVFVDSIQRLVVSGSTNETPAEQLARKELAEVNGAVRQAAEHTGVSWLSPSPNEPLAPDHAVLGEADAHGIIPGRVATCLRPGFRRRGVLCVAPQVLVARAGLGAAPVPRQVGASLTDPPAPDPSVLPAVASEPTPPTWLVGLRLAQAGGVESRDASVVEHLAELVRAAAKGAPATAETDTLVRAALEPVLGVLGSGSSVGEVGDALAQAVSEQRSELTGWLARTLGLVLFSPRPREPVDHGSMEVSSERRTAHPHEVGTVARLDRPGLRRDGTVLTRARVVSYVAGDEW